jgi:tetratricopeptide (TPR) repeat protein
VNRGEAYRNAQDLATAIEDHSAAITIMSGIRDELAPRGEWAPALQNRLAVAHMNRGNAYQNAQDFAAAIEDYGVALPILSQLADTFAEFGVDVHRLLANWSLLGVGLTPDHIRLALTNLQRLQARFDAPTLARLEIPKFNRQIADGLPKVTPALLPTELAAARTALLSTE